MTQTAGEKASPQVESQPASVVDATWNLPAVVGQLRQSREVTNKIRHRGRVRELPSRTILTEILTGLEAALFPTHYGRSDLTDDSIDYFVGNTLHTALTALTEQVRRSLFFASAPNEEADADLGR